MSNARNIAGITTDAVNASSELVPVYACRAWVNFAGDSGSTADNKTIRDAGNVSSVYETSQGRFTINFDKDMPDANYAVAGMSGNSGITTAGRDVTFDDTLSASSCSVRFTYYDSTLTDDAQTTLAFFR